jgi:Family of unknown function (DUF5681)
MARGKNEGPTEYEVGRGKPPVHTRFMKGQSGNPGGRRKGSRNVKTALQKVLIDRTFEITENGRPCEVPGLEAIVLAQLQAALQGKLRAMDSLLDRMEHHDADEPRGLPELSEDDQAILERELGPKRLQSSGDGSGGSDPEDVEPGND